METKKWLTLIGALACGTFAVVPMAWGGPYLFRSVEASPASGHKECRGQIVAVLSKLDREGRLSFDKDSPHLGSTRASTVHVDCIVVGENEQRRNSWAFYIVVASTDRQEAGSLLDQLRTRFRKFVRID